MPSLLAAVLLVAAPAAAQAADEAPPTQTRLAELHAELDGIDTEGPDFAAEMGAQMVGYAILLTVIGSFVELVSQEISARWRFQEPPWFLIAGAGVGAILGAIGTPLLLWGVTDGRHRQRRELREEIERLEVTAAPAPSGAWAGVTGTF
jgi:hypothetical protein